MSYIRGLGQINQKSFPVLPTVGAVGGAGLLVGGLILRKTPGTVMGIVGGTALAGSLVALVLDLMAAPASPLPAPAPVPIKLPAAPKAAKPPAYTQYAEYAKAALPIVSNLFSSLFGPPRQPGTMVVR